MLIEKGFKNYNKNYKLKEFNEIKLNIYKKDY